MRDSLAWIQKLVGAEHGDVAGGVGDRDRAGDCGIAVDGGVAVEFGGARNVEFGRWGECSDANI